MKPTYPFTYLLGCLLVTFGLLTVTPTAEAQDEVNLNEFVMKGDYIGLSAAIANGEEVNQQTRVGNTPLMVAAKIGDRRTLEVLLENNADVNLRNNAGATALMIAAKYDNPNVVAELLNYGADPTIKTNNGHTAAAFALAYKRYQIFDHLVKAEETFIAKM